MPACVTCLGTGQQPHSTVHGMGQAAPEDFPCSDQCSTCCITGQDAGMATMLGEQGDGTWLQLLGVSWAAEHIINCSSFLWGKTAEDKTQASGKQLPLLCLSFSCAFFAASLRKRLTREAGLATEQKAAWEEKWQQELLAQQVMEIPSCPHSKNEGVPISLKNITCLKTQRVFIISELYLTNNPLK